MNNDIILQVKNLTQEYTGDELKLLLLNDISFELRQNSFTGILAPQHSKKTLLLEIVAGLSEPTSGRVETFNNRIVYIPSKPSSFPWLSVTKNIELGFNHNKNVKTAQISNLIDLVGLHGYDDHFPDNKSLGFRFRIALARALAAGAKLILIDEPLNYMDQITKLEMYILLRQVYIQTGISFLIATSNISEAVFLSDRIIILSPQSSGIINETFTTISNLRNADLFKDKVFKEKVKEIEELVKREESMVFNSFLI